MCLDEYKALANGVCCVGNTRIPHVSKNTGLSILCVSVIVTDQCTLELLF